MRTLTIALVVLGATLGTQASQPGQPLDCSDWVSLAPGISCSPVLATCSGQACVPATAYVIDNSRERLWLRQIDTGERCPTEQSSMTLLRLELVATSLTTGTDVVVGFFKDRCSSFDRADAMRPASDFPFAEFDTLNGTALVVLNSYLASACGWCDRYSKWWIAGITGFANLFDVLQSFTPQSSLGFRTPAMPEGMRAADHFDTYYGSVTRPLDLSQAHPLQCGYPSTSPHVGDYEAITATVPTPTPGAANYVLTTVTHQGQTRAGRQAIDGHLRGREASVLPACVIEKKASNAGEATR